MSELEIIKDTLKDLQGWVEDLQVTVKNMQETIKSIRNETETLTESVEKVDSANQEGLRISFWSIFVLVSENNWSANN